MGRSSAALEPLDPGVLEIFNGVARHHLINQDRVVQVFEPTLTPLQHQVLDLLAIPAHTYTNATTADGTP